MKQGSANRPARPRHARPIIRRGAKTALSVTLAAALSCMTPAAALANDEEVASPTDAEHSRLVYSFEDVYQYGGYHRASLPEDSWIAMREG